MTLFKDDSFVRDESRRNGLTVDDGSSDREKDELGGHRKVESFREVFGLGHISDEGRNEG